MNRAQKEADNLAAIVDEQVTTRALAASNLATSLFKLPDSVRRKQAAFSLRCDDGCEIAAIYGRTRIANPGGPPNNELLVCWTRKGWRADLARWYITDQFFDRLNTLSVACKHGFGLFDIGAINAFVCHAGPESQMPDTLFAFGSTRRLSDRLGDLDGSQLATWSTARGSATLSKLSSEGWTVGQLALRESWQPRT